MLRRIRNKGLGVLLTIGSLVLVGAVASTAFATTTIQTNICSPFTPPSITEPTSGTETDASSIIVKGTGEPAMSVVILDNGVSIGTTMILPDGSYGLEVPLTVGSHTLIARETGGCMIEDSPSVSVSRTSTEHPPQPIPLPLPQATSPSQPVIGTLPSAKNPPPSQQSPDGAIPATPGYPKPTITQPKTGQQFMVDHAWVSGKAQPGSIVTIYINGGEDARVIASDDGMYGAMVRLHPGKNTLYVRSQLNGKSATSETVEVQYIQHAAHVATQTWGYFWIVPLLILLLLLLLFWYVYRRRKSQDIR